MPDKKPNGSGKNMQMSPEGLNRVDAGSVLSGGSRSQERFQGFSKKSLEDRFQQLIELGFLSEEDAVTLREGPVQGLELGEKLIENTVSYFQLPMGVAVNLTIDGRERVVPLAVEETSIIAALCKTAKWIQGSGHVETWTEGSEVIGQIQIPRVQNLDQLRALVETKASQWIESANREVAHGLVKRGGGVTRILLRTLDRPQSHGGGTMAVIHVYMDPCDAMGANIMNQVVEFLKGFVEQETKETVGMCILSNLVDSKLTGARVTIRDVEEELGQKIEEASLFAELDPYRASTSNKGVMNGIDPVLIATGNDWRAVEAGVHAFAARSGSYSSVTKWRFSKTNKTLVGEFLAPVVVGTVGGVTQLHPTAKLALKILQVESASDLSRICAACGLLQNLGALRALTTVGIIEGHMRLHIQNLSLAAGTKESEMPVVARKLEEILKINKRISLSHALEVLKEVRAQTN